MTCFAGAKTRADAQMYVDAEIRCQGKHKNSIVSWESLNAKLGGLKHL